MKKLFLLLGFAFTMHSGASAQMKVNKLGYINSLELLSVMPESKPADDQLDKYAKDLEDLYDKMLQEGQTKVDEFQKMAEDPAVSEAQKELKANEIQDLQKRIQDFENGINDKIGKQKDKLYGPILDKANKAIQEVSKENGYTYVFDSSTGAIIYAEESDDILPLVKKKLGIVDPPK